MHTENNDFYFDKNDYLHFNNVKFIIERADGNGAVKKIVNNKYKDRAIILYLNFNYDISNYEIHVNFSRKDNKDSKQQLPKLLTTKNKQANKMSLLYCLKKMLLSIYNALLLYKYHKANTELSRLKIRVYFANKVPNNINNTNVAFFSNYNIYLFIYIDDLINFDNTVLIENRMNEHISLDKIIIKNNRIYEKFMTITHPGSYNFNLEKIIKPYLIFHELYYNFIVKMHNYCTINYCTPLPLLVNFISNIESFNNVQYMYVNNEYDLLKYL